MSNQQQYWISDAERRQILQNTLVLEVAQGNRVAWVGNGVAHVWRMPAPINHVVHALICLLTFGFWLIPWLVIAAAQPKPVLVGIAVNDQGQPYNFTPRPPAEPEPMPGDLED